MKLDYLKFLEISDINVNNFTRHESLDITARRGLSLCCNYFISKMKPVINHKYQK